MKIAPAPGRSGTDRWLMSYADLVTLLLAFFMTLYAASKVDSKKMAPVAESLQEAFSTPVDVSTTPSQAAAVRSVPKTPSKDASLEELQLRLSDELAGAISDRRLEVMRDPRGLIVSFPDDATFPTGSFESTLEARQLIARVGETLLAVSNRIRIEGHTDNVPIRTSRFGSNWELSTARASAVVAFLISTVGIEPARLSAAGYGEFHPREGNDTDAHRARNRRVDLVILDDNDPRERTAAAVPEPNGRP